MNIPESFLKENNDWTEAYEYWVKVAKPNLFEFIEHCLNDNHFDYAVWLINKCMSRIQQVKSSVFAAELALPIFEKEHPEDSRPRKMIEAAKKVIENDTPENQEAAMSASAAASAAADAAKPSYAASYAAYAAAYAYHASDYDYAFDAEYTSAADYAEAADYASSATYYAAEGYGSSAKKEIQRNIITYGIELLKKKNEWR
jgi:hypothetical protein